MYKMSFSHKSKKKLLEGYADLSCNIDENGEYINKEIPCEYYKYIYNKKGKLILLISRTKKGFEKGLRKNTCKKKGVFVLTTLTKYGGDPEWEYE